MEQRRNVQKEAMLQKEKISVEFEKMKKKGKMDPNILSKLGFTSTTKSTTHQGGINQTQRNISPNGSINRTVMGSMKHHDEGYAISQPDQDQYVESKKPAQIFSN